MRITVAEGAAIKNNRMIEQRAVYVRRRFQLLHESSEKLHVEAVDLRYLLDEVGMPTMVRERMVRVGDADLGIGTHAALAPQHHCRNACQVGLKRDRLQIEHQLHVLPVRKWDSRRLLQRRLYRILLR